MYDPVSHPLLPKQTYALRNSLDKICFQVEFESVSFTAASSSSFFFQYSSSGGPNIAFPETTPIMTAPTTMGNDRNLLRLNILRERERERERLNMPESIFTEIKIPHHQKPYDGDLFPAVLSPKPNTFSVASGVTVLTEAIKSHKPWLESLIHKAGAVLFRGFPVTTADDFNDVVEAFGFEELPYVGGAAPRTNVVGRVFTSNESPSDQKIPFHHEMAQVPKFPAKLFFFCEVEPGKGGETPIVLSNIVYERMKEKYPEFVERLEEHGLIYTRVLGEDDDPTSPIGRGWKSTFLTKDKSVAEERAAKLGMKLEWMEDGGVKTVMGPIPAIKVDKSRQRKIWFNSMVAAYTGWEDARNDPVKAVTFGDGKPLPADIIYDCLNILDEESVAIPWQKGDVILLDNWAVLHSRRPFNPPRRVLASLCK